MDKKSNSIHYYIHGRGRGHATRALKIVETLERAGWRIRIFSGHDALGMICGVHPVESVCSLMPKEVIRLGPRLVNRVRQAKKEIEQDIPAMIVSDGDLPSILAAKICGLPAIAVGHAEVFGETRRPSGTPRLPWWKEKIGAKISSATATRHVAVNFVKTSVLNGRTVVAGPSVDFISRTATPSIDAVCYFRDENGDSALKALVNMGWSPLLFSRSKTEREGVRVEPLNRRRFLDALKKTRLVVASAGSQLISECVLSGIPIFALYKKRDDEQRINVFMLRKTGIGDGTSFEDFRKENLRGFVTTMAYRSSGETIPIPHKCVDSVVLEQVEKIFAEE